MGRTADGAWSEEWTPPTFTVDRNGKIVGYVNDRTPNNWGRWGELDERGTVNLITPEKIAQAASLIKTGQVISCAIPLDSGGPVHPTRTGVVHMYAYTGSDFVSADCGAAVKISSERSIGCIDRSRRAVWAKRRTRWSSRRFDRRRDGAGILAAEW